MQGAPANLWVRNGLEDDQGALWLSSNETGVFKLTPRGVTQYTTRQGLPSNVIQCLIRTRDGSIWACTESGAGANGVPRWRGCKDRGVPRRARAWQLENVRAACEDTAGKIWVGGEGLVAECLGRQILHIRGTAWYPADDRCGGPYCVRGTPFGLEPPTDSSG